MNKVDKAGKSGNEKVTRDVFVEVPRGWSRGLEKDNVVYISPTSECLRSKQEVVNYLISCETCKCGLECPLYIDKTFNFDASVPSRHFRISDWDKDGHTTACNQTLGAMNAYKYQTPAWAKTGGTKNHSSMVIKEEKELDTDSSKVHLPSFETFTQLAGQKHKQTLPGRTMADMNDVRTTLLKVADKIDVMNNSSTSSSSSEQAKSKKSIQAKRAGCYKRKSTTVSQDLSAVTSLSDQSNKIQDCITVQSTSTPIPHSYVKNNVETKQSNEMVLLTQHIPKVSKAVVRQEEQRYSGLKLAPVPLLSFPSSHLNASSYLASLSTGGSTNVPNRTPSKDLSYFSHSGGIVCPPVQTVAAPHSFANTSRMDCPSFTQKPVTTVFSTGAKSTTYLSPSTHAKNSQKPTTTIQESLLKNAALPTSNNGLEKLTLGKSKGGFSMKNTSNVRTFSSVNNLYSPQYIASTATSSLSAPCTATSSPMSYSKTQDVASKAVASAHGQQITRMKTMDISENAGEPVAPRAMYPATALMTHADKNKQRPSTSAPSKAGELVNQPFQYCGILLPATGIVPQVQVAGGSGIQLQQASPLVDPSHFTNLYALQGIPYANNVGTLGNSGMFGVTPGVLPYVLGIAQTSTATKSTTATAITSKASPTSSGVVSNCSTTSTAAIAAAYSAFVSIAPASGTSSNYSQQLMNLVSNYNNPYWQQILSHGTNAQALAYQLMQMNQYAALRGAAGQPAANVKTPTTKPLTFQAKQATTIATAATSVTTAATSVTTTATSVTTAATSVTTAATSVTTATTAVTTSATSVTTSATAVTDVATSVTTAATALTTAATSVTTSVILPSDCTGYQAVIATPVSVDVDSKDLCSVPGNKTTGNKAVVETSLEPTITTECPVQKTSKVKSSSVTETIITSYPVTSGCKRTEMATTVMCTSSKDYTSPRTSDNTSKQNIASDTLRERHAHCDSHQNDAEKSYKVEESKSIPQISHDIANKDVLYDNLNSSKNNSENVNEALGSRDIKSRTCESIVASTVDESKHCTANTDSFVKVTDINDEEDISVDSPPLDNSLPSDEGSNSRSLDTTDTVQEDTKKDLNQEEIDVVDEIHVNVDSVKYDDTEEQDKDEAGFNCVVQNGEAQSSSNDISSDTQERKDEDEDAYCPVEFTIGDVVWAQARGLPSWPGKIVDERDVGSGRADNGKKWVMWFGDRTFSQVEIEKLKTLTEGLKTLDDKGKKRKFRGKKTKIALEQAISEALEELDQKDRLRSRQGPKAKRRRLRV